MQKVITTPVKVERLSKELVTAVPVLASGTGSDRTLYFQVTQDGTTTTLHLPDTLTPAEQTSVDTVIANHDGTTPTQDDVRDQADHNNLTEWHDQANQMLARDDQIINQMASNPTPAQVAQAVSSLATSQKRIIKMVDRLTRVFSGG